MKTYINANDTAKLLKVNRSTVVRWIREGKFEGATRIPGTKEWRIPLLSYEAFSKKYYEGHQL
jgi:excisionase family DNA binding protein